MVPLVQRPLTMRQPVRASRERERRRPKASKRGCIARCQMIEADVHRGNATKDQTVHHPPIGRKVKPPNSMDEKNTGRGQTCRRQLDARPSNNADFRCPTPLTKARTNRTSAPAARVSRCCLVPVKQRHEDHESNREQRPSEGEKRHGVVMLVLGFHPSIREFIHNQRSREDGITLPHFLVGWRKQRLRAA